MSSPGVSLSSSAEKNLNKGKKRAINVSLWKNNRRKLLRACGMPYLSKKNVPISGKTPSKHHVVCKCTVFKCSLITLEDKRKLFEEFYKCDYNTQTNMLTNCMTVLEVGRRRTPENISRRHCTVKYQIKVRNQEIRICQKTLCDIYKITPRRIQYVVDKIKFGKDIFDQRGKHGNRPHAITEATKEAVTAFIASFPQNESHYSRHQSKKKCLSADLNLKKLYKLYCVKEPKLPKISETSFRDIFRSNFNLRFGLPRSDSCATCDRLYMKLVYAKSDSERAEIEIESNLHHSRADIAYKSLSEDTAISKINKKVVNLCVDLQQVLFAPKLCHSSMFYQRQYSCYNLAIHNTGEEQAYMYFWHESIAKRGSAEVASCILKYINENFEPLNLEFGETRELIIWSDRCVGQNNNWKMISLLQHLLTNKYFTAVNQKFLTTGHSFLPCDRDFSMIERNKKHYKVYHPDDWMAVIANSKNSGKGFLVIKMTNDDFKDFSILENSLNKGTLKITEFVWYKLCADDPITLNARKSHNILQPWTRHYITRLKFPKGNKRERLPPVQIFSFRRLYQGPLGIKPAKKKDLIDMTRYIPPKYRSFYSSLPTTDLAEIVQEEEAE